MTMAKSITGSFWLTDTVQIQAVDTFTNGTISLAAYIDVGDSQAIAVEQIDIIIQAYDTATNSYNSNMATTVAGNVVVASQVSDQAFPTASMLVASANSLVASGAWYYDDANNISSTGTDLFPDVFGKLDEARMVINDQLYLQTVLGMSPLVAGRELAVTFRCKCRLIRLTKSDWMSLAVQSSAAV